MNSGNVWLIGRRFTADVLTGAAAVALAFAATGGTTDPLYLLLVPGLLLGIGLLLEPGGATRPDTGRGFASSHHPRAA